ncbi:Phospholipase C [Lunasporangiospora selenospora]|uniref:Phosphoinositide phospholipase C n=1 Tax=Lunasporangiospora selenospora TaxID=979761 RepID=A0A9P6FR33_9FUNG|nr:Phospholipase C [Lunasporangiospora selenospora]
MFGKIKKAISGWNQDDPQPEQTSPHTKKGLRSSSSFRRSLPARFRTSIYRQSSSSSSSDDLPPPPPPAKDQPSVHVHLPGVSTPHESCVGHQRSSTEPIGHSLDVSATELQTTESVPKSHYIRRTSSFQSQNEASESCREVCDTDIIIFSATPPTPSDASAESNGANEARQSYSSSSSPESSKQVASDSHKEKDGESSPLLSTSLARQFAAGTQMLKISAKKQRSRLFKLDLEQGKILWDSRKLGKINVEQIKELRKGKAARMYREQLKVQPEHEERWLTIIYSLAGKYKALHLVAPTKDTYHDWITVVERMWSKKREEVESLPQLQRKDNQWIKEHWMDADKNVDSKLGFDELVRLCHRLNINFSKKEIRQRFDQADEKKQGFLDFSNFTQFVKLLKERKDIAKLYQRVSRGDAMSFEEFEDFMLSTQRSNFDLDHIKGIYHKHLDKNADVFTVDSFTSFLLSSDNSIVAPHHMTVHQDMSQSLSNYFISSSHNTYLLGHQLTGISSIEGYIRALQAGCRCVELDCWDGSDGQPVIYHGHTLTTKILFRDVIEAISTYAFVSTPYPLILSLEIHCDLDQQEIMASIMRVKLGSWLVLAPLFQQDGESSGEDDRKYKVLPSPHDLKYKILVKSKVLPPEVDASEYVTDTESESEKGMLERKNCLL